MKYRIKELVTAKRAELGRKITLQEIASETGVSQPMLSKLASSEPPNITAKKVEALCKYFGVSPNELMIIEPSVPAARGVDDAGEREMKSVTEPETPALSPETLYLKDYIERRIQYLDAQNAQIAGTLQRMEGYLKKIAEGTNQSDNPGD